MEQTPAGDSRKTKPIEDRKGSRKADRGSSRKRSKQDDREHFRTEQEINFRQLSTLGDSKRQLATQSGGKRRGATVSDSFLFNETAPAGNRQKTPNRRKAILRGADGILTC